MNGTHMPKRREVRRQATNSTETGHKNSISGCKLPMLLVIHLRVVFAVHATNFHFARVMEGVKIVTS